MSFKRPTTEQRGTGKTPPKFQYRARTAEEMQKRAHQGAGNREGYVLAEINTWTPSDGENKIRILPPTWDDAVHYGYEVFVHYQIGSDKGTYICLNKMKAEPCPICDVRQELDHAGDDEAARELLPRKRVAMFVIDRKEESKGPMIWFSPWTLDQEIAKQSIDEDGGALALDSPEDGYDVTFSREQQGKNVPPKYVGVKVARKASPLFNSEEEITSVMDYVVGHPIPSCLLFHEYEAVKKVFEGGPGRRAPDETPPERARTTKSTKEPEKVEEQVELPSWKEVHEMDEDGITTFTEAAGVDFSEEEFDDLAACADWVCAQLDISAPPHPKAAGGGKPSIGKPSVGKKAEATEAPASDWKAKLSKFRK